MSIKQNLSSGILYIAIAKYSSILISIFIGAILARLLSPAEFGVVAIVMVFITFFNILCDIGLGPSIIQNKDLEKSDIESIFSFSFLVGIFFSVLFFFSSSIIADFYNNFELVNIIRCLSLSVFFYSLRIVPNALLSKSLKFKHIGIATIIVQILSGSLAILLAYKGLSYYALVFKSIFDGLFTFLAFYWMSPIRFSFRIKMESIRKIAKFSMYQFFFNFINYFSRNSDNLLIGKFLSPVALGYYDKSYQLMMMPISNLTHVITPVLHPILSQFQHDKKIVGEAYLKVIRLLAVIGFPLSIFLFFSAPEIINILYGVQWEQSIPVFKLLSLTVGIQMVLSSSGSIFQALNRTDMLFYSGLISSLFMVGGICYGIFIDKSLVGVGYGLIFAFTINFFICFYILINTLLESSFFGFLKILAFPLLISLIVGIELELVSLLKLDNNYLSLIVKIICTTVLYGVSLLCSPEYRTIISNFVKRKL